MKPILPKKPLRINVVQTRQRVERVLQANMRDAQRRFMRYPPQQPTTYRRTGRLGGTWTVEPSSGAAMRGRDLVCKVGNVVPYAVYVEGPTESSGLRQTLTMRAKGWQSMTDIKKAIEPMLHRQLRDAVLESVERSK